MRVLITPILVASFVLPVVAAAPASADQMIQELRSTWAKPAATDTDSARAIVQPTTAAERATPTVRRHKAGSRSRRQETDQP